MVQWLPVLSIDIKQVHFSVSICVLATNEQDFAVWNSQCAAGPKWVLHSDGQDLPLVLINFVHLNCIVDLLLGTAEETTKCVDVLISNRACTEIVSLVFHRGNLIPLVFANVILFDRAESLLTRETAKDKDATFANGDRMCVSTLCHLSLVQDLILLCQINSGIFFWWWSSTSNQDLGRTQSNGSRTLIKFVAGGIW